MKWFTRQIRPGFLACALLVWLFGVFVSLFWLELMYPNLAPVPAAIWIGGFVCLWAIGLIKNKDVRAYVDSWPKPGDKEVSNEEIEMYRMLGEDTVIYYYNDMGEMVGRLYCKTGMKCDGGFPF